MDNSQIKNQQQGTVKTYEDYQKAYENYELEYWSNRFGVSREVLKQAIAKVGLSATAVEQYIKKVIAG